MTNRIEQLRDSASDINVVAVVKKDERYIFIFSDDNRAECLRTLGRFATDETLSFSWYDAAVASQRIRKLQVNQE